METIDLHVRPCTTADTAWVLALAPRLHEFGPPPFRTIGEMDRAVTASLRRTITESPAGSTVLVAEDSGGGLLGFIHLETATDYFTGERHGHVSDLVVAVAGEGRGAGRALMTAGEAWASGLGYRLLSLNVFEDNHRARQLYRNLGFRTDTIKLLKEIHAII